MNNELFYITSHQLPSNTAHSLQIAEMCRAFNSYVKFQLISPLNKKNKNKKTFFKWKKIQINSKLKFFFKIEFFLKLLYFLAFKKKNKVSIIFTRNIEVALLCIFLNSKFIFEIHQSPTLIGKFILKFISKKKNFYLIAISNSLKKNLKKKFKFFNEVLAFHDGVNITSYKRILKFDKELIRKKLKLDNKKIYLLYSGSMYKGLSKDEINSIISEFKQVHIICIGASPSEKKELSKQVNSKKFFLIERIPQSKLIFYQIACDYLILPLKKKGPLWWCTSPLKLFEYMATKNLIISSGIGSINEVLNSKNCVFYSKDVNEGLRHALNADYKKLANKAFNDVEQNYTWKIRVEKILLEIKRNSISL